MYFINSVVKFRKLISDERSLLKCPTAIKIIFICNIISQCHFKTVIVTGSASENF